MGGNKSKHEHHHDHHHTAKPEIIQQASTERVVTSPEARIDPMNESEKFPAEIIPQETIKTVYNTTTYDQNPSMTLSSEVIPTSTQGIPPTTVYESTTTSMNQPHSTQDYYK